MVTTENVSSEIKITTTTPNELLDPNNNISTLDKSNHQRNESSYSQNFSVLREYDIETLSHRNSMSEDEIDQELPDPSFTNEIDNLELSQGTSNDDSSTQINNCESSEEERRSNRDSFVKPTNSETDQQILKSDCDRYGFKKTSSVTGLTLDEYNEWFKSYSQYSQARKKKWLKVLTNNNNNIPTRFPPRSDKVKKMIRRGIPPEWRGNAWFFYAGGYEKLSKNVGTYERIVKATYNVKTKDTEVIERDLNRTFPDNIYFNSSIKGVFSSLETLQQEKEQETLLIKSLRRVLVAFAQHQPQIGYCQSLNFLAGLLLLFMEEEKAFWMLVILTERIIPKVHSANLEGVHTDQGVLMLCVKEYIPQLWQVLGKNFDGETLSEDKILSRLPPVTLVTSSWFMSVFVGILPIETTLRLWDILWYEGSKTIFRFSLTIFKIGSGSGGGGESEQIELFQFMQNFPKKILDANLLIDLCFKKIGGYGFGSLSQDEINKCRAFVSKQREKLTKKSNQKGLTDMTDEERNTLLKSSTGFETSDIHDVYGFNRSIMSGMVWNKNISNKMKKKFVVGKRNSSR
ncbi:Rab-GTPase-TBC domain family protein [Candida albicans]|uniref:Oxidant-induced cell-cycle arrest protein 5 n=1 Tax=Candida albicans TaxID=5476 RepID=A0A8H6BXK5_CANAX|nr:Rab-GTPase-TBC domain family protein [Candida albicans]